MTANFEEGKREDFPVVHDICKCSDVPCDPKGSGIRNLERLFFPESKLVWVSLGTHDMKWAFNYTNWVIGFVKVGK